MILLEFDFKYPPQSFIKRAVVGIGREAFEIHIGEEDFLPGDGYARLIERYGKGAEQCRQDLVDLIFYSGPVRAYNAPTGIYASAVEALEFWRERGRKYDWVSYSPDGCTDRFSLVDYLRCEWQERTVS